MKAEAKKLAIFFTYFELRNEESWDLIGMDDMIK